jgi:hypothetical protein
MSARRGSAHYAGLLPVELSDEPLIRPTSLENDWLQDAPPSLRKRALHALSFLITFCTGVAVAFAWWSYGDATSKMIANSYPQLGWLAPRRTATVQKAPDLIAPAGSAVPHPDQRQLDPMSGDDLRAMRLSLDRIVVGQELITRAVEEIATSVAAGKEQMTRNTDQTATRQEPTTRSSDQTAATVTTGQGADQSSVDQAPLAKASGIAVESRADGAALQPAARVNIKPSEAGLPQTLSERGKQSPAASGHDAFCFPSASAVLQNHPGASPTWTLRAPGHEGTLCWHAASRSNGSDHRRETMPRETKTDRTTENGLAAQPARYAMPPDPL